MTDKQEKVKLQNKTDSTWVELLHDGVKRNKKHIVETHTITAEEEQNLYKVLGLNDNNIKKKQSVPQEPEKQSAKKRILNGGGIQ